MDKTAKINEIFESIQGEGLLVGVKQLFIRFCGCNLNCEYCDTLINSGNVYGVEELIDKLQIYDFSKLHSISLTGGEPLLHADFLTEFLYKLKNKNPNIKFYLETNATLSDKIPQVLEYIDIIAADIKLPSSAKVSDQFLNHDKFFKTVKNYRIDCAVTKQFDCKEKELYCKIVFNDEITSEEIDKSTELAKKYGFEIILQPQMNGTVPISDSKTITEVFDKFLQKYEKVRVIPQTHKIINIA